MANYTVINDKEIWTNKDFFDFSSFLKNESVFHLFKKSIL